MTCMSPIKSPIVVIKASNGVQGNIISSCTTIYESFGFLVLRILTKPFEFRETYGTIKDVYVVKRMYLGLLKDLECYNLHQMIIRTMFYNHIISFLLTLLKSSFMRENSTKNERGRQTKSFRSQLPKSLEC